MSDAAFHPVGSAPYGEAILARRPPALPYGLLLAPQEDAEPESAGGPGGDADPSAALELGMQGNEGPVPHLEALREQFRDGLELVRCFFGPQATRAC